MKRGSNVMTWRAGWIVAAVLACALLGLGSGTGRADDPSQPGANEGDDLVQLDFNDAELTTIIDAISKMTGRNFIYDDRVRGKVTIKSPTRITRAQAYAVFESVLQVKGFTTVKTPGGALKIIPLRDAKQSDIDTTKTAHAPPNTDRFVTRLIPLQFIDATSISNTLKPLVSKDGSIDAYEPTNMVIVTESATNIRRLLAIMEAIDVETYKDELAIFKIEHADARTLADQVSEIYGAEVSSTTSSRTSSSRRSSRTTVTNPSAAGASGHDKVRLITDERTNSVIAMAPRTQMQDVRKLIERLDIPVSGSGTIHVYYLQHAAAEELAQTLQSLVSGTVPASSAKDVSAGGAQALRAVIQGLAEGVKITADPATNSLVIQSSREGFNTLSEVIAKLDVERPQVLVEALIMEVDVTDSEDLGFTGMYRLINGNSEITTVVAPAVVEGFTMGGPVGAGVGAAAAGVPLIQRFLRNTTHPDAEGNATTNGSVIDGIIRASAGDAGTNIVSAPHLLTMDNEEAEIRIGQNIPIITNRVQSAQGVTNATGNLATSVNVERQDIGVTLRVTPQITEGDSLRLEIFQEISAINEGLSAAVGGAAEVGVPLSKREIENVVTIRDGETVVIGGLLSDEYQDTVSKVPWLGDIPILGWAFKTSKRQLRKINLLVLLTPHIIRLPRDLELETIRKREEFAKKSKEGLGWSERERAAEHKRQQAAAEAGEEYTPTGDNPVRNRLLDHEARYPEERIGEINKEKARDEAAAEAARIAALHPPQYAVQAVVGKDADAAVAALQELIDEGYDGTLVSNEVDGTVYFNLQIGPFKSIEEAQQASELVRDVHGLEPTVVVVPGEAPEEP
jgi:general secretion pathway protein D